MVAAVQAPDRTIAAIHRTYLLPGGTGKAQVSKPKMALGPLGSGAVRLAKAGPVLGLGEGIETALSAMQLFGVRMRLLPAPLHIGRTSLFHVPTIRRHLEQLSNPEAPRRRSNS